MEKKYLNLGGFSKAFSVNEGERAYMLGIYNYMSIALMLSAVVAYFAAKSGLALAIFSSPFGVIVSLAPIGISLYIGIRFQKMSFESVRNSLLLYAGVMGLSLSTIFLVFRFQEIAYAFFVTAAMFGGMSIYGLTTKRDLSSFGSIAMMAVWGILVAGLFNMFFHSSRLSMVISMISVVVFSGLVAFDTQKLRQMYYILGSSGDEQMAKKVAVFGAMQLYVDVVAIFVNLLQLIRLSRDN